MPGAFAEAPGIRIRDVKMTFDLSFSGNPIVATDAAGGHADIVLRTPRAQQIALRRPRRGPLGRDDAMYFDGWSTWVELAVQPRDEVEVRLGAWVAPRAFARGDARGFTAVIDASQDGRGVSLGYLKNGRVAAVVDGELLEGERRLSRDRWYRLVLDVAGGQAVLRVDGERAAEVLFSKRTVSIPPRVLVGRTREAPLLEEVFMTAGVNGLIAHAALELLNSNATTEPGVERPNDSSTSTALTAPDRSRYDGDAHRPIAHITAPQGWMNEPHAPIEVDGVHHIFSQHNPAGPYWDRIAWAHSVSEDLVRWRDEPIALAPADATVAPDGIWSGSSVIGEAGEHLLYFTAGDMSLSPDQRVAVARRDGADWVPDAEPVLNMPTSVPGRAETLIAGQFRDPFVWREGATWFMIVGAGLDGAGGVALLFTSNDGTEWEQQEPLLVGNVELFPATGVMWELPVLLPLGPGADGQPRHVLLVAPWWAGPSQYHLQHVWHWVGVWDSTARKFVPDHAEPREFDGGGHLTGPSGTVLSDGRPILWTIAQDKRRLDELARTGWAHNAGWPLELGLHEDGTLAVGPLTELAGLRGGELPLGATGILVRGRHLDIEVEVSGGGFALEVLRTDDGSECTVVGVTGREVWVDRSNSSRVLELQEARRSILRPDRDRINARVVVDGSMVEMYVDGRVSLTSRAFPVGEDATQVRLRLDEGSHLEHIAAYPLTSAYEPVRRQNLAAEGGVE